MTENSLKNYIRCFNLNRWKYPVSFFDINKNVTVGKIFPDYFKGKIIDIKTERYFFIKNDNQCVGIIFDMDTDLHWFILKKYRRQGHLYNALQNSILPFLKSEGKNNQRCTAATAEGEQYLLRFGFKQQSDNTYLLSLNDFESFNDNTIQRTPLRNDQIINIRSKLYLLSKELHIIANSLECAYNNDYDLNSFASDLIEHAREIYYNHYDRLSEVELDESLFST